MKFDYFTLSDNHYDIRDEMARFMAEVAPAFG
jgi:hypothetical protein